MSGGLAVSLDDSALYSVSSEKIQSFAPTCLIRERARCSGLDGAFPCTALLKVVHCHIAG